MREDPYKGGGWRHVIINRLGFDEYSRRQPHRLLDQILPSGYVALSGRSV